MAEATRADPPCDETYSEEETKRRAEATLKVMLATPHEKHKPLGKRKLRAKRGG